MSMPTRRLAFADALRGIASLAVFAQHSFERAVPLDTGAFLNGAPGVFGVVTFFILSGFVMPFSVSREPPLNEYVVRRLFRIYPAYLAALAFAALSGLIAGTQATNFHFTGVELLSNLLFLFEYLKQPAYLGVTWTISLEIVWYVLFAAIYYTIGERWLRRMHTVLCAGLLAAGALSLAYGVRLPTGRVAMVIAAVTGSLFAQWYRGQLSNRKLAASTALFAAAVTLATYASFGHLSHPNITLFQASTAWSLGTVLTLALIIAAKYQRLPRYLEGPAWVRLGTISYSVYLLHGPIISAMEPFVHGWTQVLVSLAVTLGLAEAMFRFVERPGMELGVRISASMTAAGQVALSK
jgi:peptidoglycan/LPS O-acetylase OafA/YrhL